MLASLAVGISIGMVASADSLLLEIRAYLNKEIKMKLDGGPWEAKAGSTVQYPITYNGTTYLPVRAVAEALEVPIQYESATKTIHIGALAAGVPILSEPYSRMSAVITSDAADRLIGGVDHGEAIYFAKVLHSNSRFQLEPNAQYTKLVLTMAIEGDETEVRIVNGATKEVIHTAVLAQSDGLREIHAAITGVQSVSIELMAKEPNTTSKAWIVAGDSYYQ